MIITEDDIWNGYRALQRYFISTRQFDPTKPLLPQKIPTPFMPKAAGLSSKLVELDADDPVFWNQEYYAYLWLFVNCLRTNAKNAPIFTNEGFKPLTWRGFNVLAGHSDKAVRYWNSWRKQHSTVSNDIFYSTYPVIDETPNVIVTVRNQISLLEKHSKRFDLPKTEIIRSRDITGNVSSGFEDGLQWHPWVKLVFTPAKENAVRFWDLVYNVTQWEAFRDVVLKPLFPSKEERMAFIAATKRFVESPSNYNMFSKTNKRTLLNLYHKFSLFCLK